MYSLLFYQVSAKLSTKPAAANHSTLPSLMSDTFLLSDASESSIRRDRANTCYNRPATPMPRKTEWIHRIGPALELLRALPSPTIDRAALQKLLQVSPRQALRILARLPSYRAGKSLLIGRLELIACLETLRQDETAAFELRRRERLDAQLRSLRRELAARRVRIAAPPEARNRLLADLPPTIQLAPGRLEIRFLHVEDLLRQLFELSQAMANDLDRFRAVADQSTVF